jgi:hypothetical protein
MADGDLDGDESCLFLLSSLMTISYQQIKSYSYRLCELIRINGIQNLSPYTLTFTLARFSITAFEE